MQKRGIKTAIAAIAAILVLAALLLAVGKWRSVYQNLNRNINESRKTLSDEVLALENAVNALGGQIQLVMPEANKNTQLRYDWLTDNTMIAHALGAVTLNDYPQDYTNSLEAFQENYRKGFRIFEADMMLSSDGCLLLAHDWERYGKKKPFGLCEFLDGEYYDGGITPLTGENLIDLMIQYPDIYVVTDTKYTDVNKYRLEFSQLLYFAQEKQATDVLDRLIVQVYNQSMYDILYEIYPWKSVIYTLYQSPDDLESVVSFCMERGIQAVTMNYWAITEETVQMFHEAGISVLTFTVNDMEDISRGRDIGIDGFYTDVAAPD